MSRALIVDDTQLGQHALTAELRGAGFEVYAAGDGYEALAAFPQVEPSVLVVDFQLPGIDGIELIERVRAFSFVPAILITAYGSPSLIERALEAQAQLVLDFNDDLDSVGPQAMELVRKQAATHSVAMAANPTLLRRRRDVLKKAELEKALLDTHGNISEAARRVGMSRGSLRYQMKRLRLWALSEESSPDEPSDA